MWHGDKSIKHGIYQPKVKAAAMVKPCLLPLLVLRMPADKTLLAQARVYAASPLMAPAVRAA